MAVPFAEQTNECYFKAMVVVFRNRLKRYLETNKSGHFTIKNTLLVMMHLFTRVFHEPLTLNIINKKYIFATYACTKAHFMSLLRFFR